MIENKAVGKSLKKKVTFEGDQKKKKSKLYGEEDSKKNVPTVQRP